MGKGKLCYSVVYVLNINQLAEARSKELHQTVDAEALRRFQYPEPEMLKSGFPPETLQFVPFPNASNNRMQRQLGCLVYDTLWYGDKELRDLEDYIDKQSETRFFDQGETHAGQPILTKVFINQSATPDVFARLELMNITGGNLFDCADGVAFDIKNAYNYNPKFLYLRDIEPPLTPVGAP